MAAEVTSPLLGREVGFVDREKELSFLRNLHNKALEGKGQVLFIAGEAGIGKTRLVTEFGQYARASGSVFASGTSYQQEAMPPYAPWVDVLRSVIKETRREVLAKIPGIWAAEISRLVPELATQAKEIGIKGWILGRETSSFITPTTDQERVRLFQAVTEFLKTSSQQRPLIMFLDDLLWADTASLQLFHYVARRISRQRIMLVATYRDVELEESHPLNRMILDLNRERLLHQITLSHFTVDFVAKLISSNLGGGEVSGKFAELIYDKTGGNPFFTEEVLRSLVEQGAVFKGDAGWAIKDVVSVHIPRSVKAAIKQRIGRLSDECSQTLSVASVIGMQFFFNLLMKIMGFDEDRLIELMESALKTRLVEEKQIGNEVVYVFADEQIRDFFYEEISLIRRRKFHLKVGQAIEKLSQDHVDELAHHYIQGGDISKAADYSARAGDNAAEIYAHQEAIKHYANALELLEETQPEKRLDILTRSAYASERLGDFRKVESFCRKAIELAENLGDVKRNAELHALLGFSAFLLTNDKPSAIKILQEGLKIIEKLEDTVEEAVICQQISRIYALTGEEQTAIPWSQRAINIAKKSGANEVLAQAYQSLAKSLPVEKKNEILSYLEESRRISLENRLEDPACRVHTNLGSVYSILKGDYKKAEDIYLKGMQYARRVGYPAYTEWMAGELALYVYIPLSELDKCEQTYLQA
ncbi:MAG: AAA family ATPase [Candidatus Bathyarchaeia archaeon]